MSVRHLPNTITCARLFGCFTFALLFMAGRGPAALTTYVALELADQLDGKLATMLRAESVTGAYFDPFVDSVTHLTAFACLMRAGIVPLWAFLIFLVREFGLLFLRLLASLQGTKLRGRWPGKLKAAVHAVVIVVCLAVLAGLVRTPGSLQSWIRLAVAASVISGAWYIVEYRGILRRAFAEI